MLIRYSITNNRSLVNKDNAEIPIYPIQPDAKTQC